jgi:hypothetical protein
MPGLGVGLDVSIKWVVDYYADRHWRRDQGQCVYWRHGCSFGYHGLGRLNGNYHGDAEWNRESQWGFNHLLLLVWHYDLARILDGFGRCGVGLHANLGLDCGHRTQPEYDVPLSTCGHELCRNIGRRQWIVHHRSELMCN